MSAVFLAAACGGGDEASSPNPQDLVPQLSDLPTGYSVDAEGTGPQSLAEALENTTPEGAALVKRERIEGYEVTFESPNVAVINCSATVYRSSDGAKEVYRLGVERAPTAAKEAGSTLEPASLEETIGEEAAAFTSEVDGVSIFIVVWRDRNVNGFCASGGLLATDPQQTVRIAQAQQARISTALG